MYNIGLKGRFLIALLAVALVPLLIFGFIEYRNAQNFYEDIHQDSVEAFQNGIGIKLDDYFINTRRELMFAHDVVVNELVHGTETEALEGQLTKQMVSFMKRHKDYDQIRLLDETGMERLRVNNASDVPVVTAKNRLQDKSDRYCFQEALQLSSGEIYVSELDLNVERGEIERPYKAVVRYIVPIEFNGGDRLYLVLNHNVTRYLKSLRDYLQASDYPETYLVDEDGYYILHSNQELEWGQPGNLNTGVNLYTLGNEIADRVLSATASGHTSKGKLVYSWQPVRISELSEMRLLMVTEVTVEEVYDPLSGFMQTLVIQVVVMFTVVFILSNVLSNYLTRPISMVSEAVDEIARGNFKTSINIEGSREIQSLGYEIKKMAFELEAMYKDMNQRVEERTKELKAAHDQMKEMANTDPLTGAFNRHYFNTYVEDFKKESRHRNLGLVMVDVDRFKYINDHYGHNVGDVILQEVSNMLGNEAREDDFVVRYGGDEFLIVLSNGDQDAIDAYIKRIKAALEHWNLSTEHLDHELELSMGSDVYERGRHIMDVINTADTRMYEDKMKRREEQGYEER